MPPRYQPFVSVQGNQVQLQGALRERIRWDRVNLVERGAVAAMGVFDAILCRNVLIYFADATAQAVAGNLAGQLAPDGVLVVGTSESLLRFGTTLQCEERSGVFMYRRSPP